MAETTNKKASESKKASNNENAALFVSPALSTFFWILAVVVICAAIGGNYFYNREYLSQTVIERLVRVLVVIGGMLLGLVFALLTNKGRTLLQFAQKSYTELRKVVWPTRQEAVQTTFIVFIAVCVLSLFLYLCDVIFLEIVRLFTL